MRRKVSSMSWRSRSTSSVQFFKSRVQFLSERFRLVIAAGVLARDERRVEWRAIGAAAILARPIGMADIPNGMAWRAHHRLRRSARDDFRRSRGVLRRSGV